MHTLYMKCQLTLTTNGTQETMSIWGLTQIPQVA